jgi:hypothetical protein
LGTDAADAAGAWTSRLVGEDGARLGNALISAGRATCTASATSTTPSTAATFAAAAAAAAATRGARIITCIFVVAAANGGNGQCAPDADSKCAP